MKTGVGVSRRSLIWGAPGTAAATWPAGVQGVSRQQTTVGAMNVRNFGAKGDGVAKDHLSIQRAIDSCAENGGGTVWVPAGTYVCGTIELRSNTRLFLDAGTVIAGSPERADYRRLAGNNTGPAGYHQNLIVAWKATNVSLSGPGVVDARGHYFYDTTKLEVDGRRRRAYPMKRWRPGPTIAFFSCSGIGLEDITIRDNPHYAVYLDGCSSGRMTGLRIITDRKFGNGDGIHADCSRGLTISGCHIDSEDDALCFYTDKRRTGDVEPVTTDIAVSDCVLGSDCCGIRIGYTGDGRLGNMVFSNVVVSDANRGIDFICTGREGSLAKGASPAGPSIHDILFSNFVINDANWGISGNIFNDTRAPAGICDILFSSMKIRSRCGNYLVGSKDISVRDIAFRDVDFIVTGKLGDNPGEIPDPIGVFSMPAIPHGFLLRHAEGVRFLNSRIRWEGAEGAWRSGLHVVDGKDIDARDLRVERWRADWTSGITSAGSHLWGEP